MDTTELEARLRSAEVWVRGPYPAFTLPPSLRDSAPFEAADALAMQGRAVAAAKAEIEQVHAAYCHSQQQFVDAAAEIERLRLLTFCGCGDQFTTHDPGTCGACVAGMTCAPGWNPGAQRRS